MARLTGRAGRHRPARVALAVALVALAALLAAAPLAVGSFWPAAA